MTIKSTDTERQCSKEQFDENFERVFGRKVPRPLLEHETCPQIGSAGVHSEDYLDGGSCIWCGQERR